MIYKVGEAPSFTMLNLALHIAYVAAECKVDTIVDLGSHEGHLLYQLAKLTQGVKLVGYEAREPDHVFSVMCKCVTFTPSGTMVEWLTTKSPSLLRALITLLSMASYPTSLTP